MANIQGQKKWSEVRLLETHELARGGINGNLNEQAKSLVDRTEFLNQEKASKSEIVQGVFEFGTYAEFDSAKSTLPLNCTVIIGEENTGADQWAIGNNRWNGYELIKSEYNPVQLANSNTLNIVSDVIPQRQIAYENLKVFIQNSSAYKNLTLVEVKVLDFIKRVEIYGDSAADFSFAIVYSNNALTTLNLTNGTSSFTLLVDSAVVSTTSDNGKTKTVRFSHFTQQNGENVFGEIEFDYSPKSYFDFTYNISEVHPNLKFKAQPILAKIPQRGVVNLEANAKGTLLTNSVYMSFKVNDPFILSSVAVDIIKIPTNQPAWVECTIYPPDNGFGTAQRISSTDQVPIEKLGSMRMPLEQKMMLTGTYTIGFKTNVPECLAVANGLFWRGYDAANRPMPATAPNLTHPITDKYGFFPAFALYKHERNVKPKFGANWHLEYRPEFNFMGGNDNTLFYLHMAGFAGTRDIWFGQSTDGGKTINKIGLNAVESSSFSLLSDAMHGVSRFVGDTFEMYIARGAGKITKVSIGAGQVPVVTDITPYANVSTNDLHSYAPLVIWKGFLWWGEYGNPEAPKIHKMDLDTGSWYVSIEKPTSGATGARHVHYLYPSPYDQNVLWANWGDASNGGGQGVNKLTVTGSKAGTGLDSWIQFSTGRHDDEHKTFPYPTAIMEIYEPVDGKLGDNEVIMIGAGDQPPVHLTAMRTKSELAGKALFKPLNFKRESAPNTETVHWLAIDEEKTIYYMTVESNPHMSIYASPYPYTDTFQLSKYWQQALSGKMYYSNGFLHTKNHRFPKVKFVNALDSVDNELSKVPYLANATEATLLAQFNKLIENLQGAGLLQKSSEIGNDKNQSFYLDESGKWENWG